MKKRAVVLLSGGLDSAVTLAIARNAGYTCYGLSFRYGQRHEYELQCAAEIAAALEAAEHRIMFLDLGAIGGSALTGDIPVPKGRNADAMPKGIPVTYVPARNTVFLSLGLAWAEVLGAHDIFIGVNALDYSGYPDCRADFIEAFEKAGNLGTREGREGTPFTIRTPLIEMTKAEIILKGTELGVDFSLTHSCYDPDEKGLACGACDSCRLRRKGFAEAGIKDPTRYSDNAGVK